MNTTTQTIDEVLDSIDEMFGRRRWLQQSPISPDVWSSYLDQKAEPVSPQRRSDLLLMSARNTEAGMLVRELRRGMGNIGGQPGAAEIAPNENTVVAKLTLKELICVAVPLTTWWQALPRELKTIERINNAFQAQDLDFKSADEVEFFAYACTAGLVSQWVNQISAGQAKTSGSPATRRPIRGPKGLLSLLSIFQHLWTSIEFLDQLPERTAIEHIHVNRKSQLALAFSRKTIKADACDNLFRASTNHVTWAIVDCGIDATHPCFCPPAPQQPAPQQPAPQQAAPPQAAAPPPAPFQSRVKETYDFTRLRRILSDPQAANLKADMADALQARLDKGLRIDWSLLQQSLRIEHSHPAYKVPQQDHGTHVAGILAANWKRDPQEPLIGICPDINLVDLRVFNDDGETDEYTILAALQFIGYLNRLSNTPAIHGANLSFSLVHRVRTYACGRTPVCEECERLVDGGTMIVAAAGNAGFTGDSQNPTLADRYSTITVTDPGNSDAVITVGSTHKISPHTYGVSYFSSRGPTADGRLKPDLVAPGEKILSALPGNRIGEKDGTSMAAPHVSGAAAILMARNPELIGKPRRIKQILCQTATDLGRERSFQGAGLVDVLRALQSI